MKKLALIIIIILSCMAGARAAYITNMPRTLVQPNGDTLRCFASGDEFYVRLHDEKGFTIVQNPTTGYFVYGVKQDGDIVPSPYIAGQCDPAAKGLQPNLCISRERYLKLRERMTAPAKRNVIRDGNTNRGNMNNVVIFIRFADDTTFENSFSSIQLMFNDSSENYTANSMFNYFKRTSYNQLFIRSHFFPEPDGEFVVSYQDSMPRSYFEPWSETNPNGYQENDTVYERAQREQDMLARACAFVDSLIPDSLDMDYNHDGYIDNVCFVVKGNVGDWNVLLWPHRWSLYTTEAYIHGKRVYDYNLQLADAAGYFNTSVMCHEMFHSLGAPDLYHYHDESGMDAVGSWDLMCSNQNPPQQTCAYMKYKYGNWISVDDIIPVDDYGTYTIMPLNSETPDRISYRFRTQNPLEIIVMDYRSQNAPFDNTIPNRGAIFYRVNALYNGNADYNGYDMLDEIYIFRANGSPTENGYLAAANFRGNVSSRREFSPLTNPYPFLSNGEVVPLHIIDFTNGPDSLQFTYTEWVSVTEHEGNSISIYPNPAQDFLTVQIAQPGHFTMQIYNVQGQLVGTAITEESTCQLNISNYPGGCYFIKIFEKENYCKTIKFIKQ